MGNKLYETLPRTRKGEREGESTFSIKGGRKGRTQRKGAFHLFFNSWMLLFHFFFGVELGEEQETLINGRQFLNKS